MTLDGELFTGRGEFQSTVSVVKTINSPHWQKVTFQVLCCSFSLPNYTNSFRMQIFDVPSMGDQPFEERIEHLKKTFGPGGPYASASVSGLSSVEKIGDKETNGMVVLVDQELAKSREHVLEKLKEVEKVGGEGLMLRKAGSCVSDIPRC